MPLRCACEQDYPDRWNHSAATPHYAASVVFRSVRQHTSMGTFGSISTPPKAWIQVSVG